ncbi:DUF695 domain-containing protein [Undibacterium seohonense]|uniref:DUF695 domain-containing protein n=1 Tax=Undibacterium seohonense TaxID=1344950 RepID=A0ABR6X3Z9_9BURK|nr:DUF695 domain-containing protein [Undibacterium seohonense]MBC3807663.1 DUF695 domain-containing protein [Undibacterium seohonense]
MSKPNVQFLRLMLIAAMFSFAVTQTYAQGQKLRTSSEHSWAIAEGKTETYPFQLRFRKIPASFPRAHYPIRINIFWKMNMPQKNGLASPADISLMHSFEDRLVATTESDGVAILTLVLTGRGEREFVFFVHSKQEFLKRLSNMPQEIARYPIEIHANETSSWDYYDNEMRNLK